MESIRVLGIAGSLRKDSYNRLALKAAREHAPDGMEISIFDRLAEIPLYDQDQEENPPEAVRDLKRRIREADAILIATPEYNFSVPGVLKNAMDWASRPYGDNAWQGKPVALMSASTSLLGGARAQHHLRQSFVFLEMLPVNLPEVLIASADERFDDEGNLVDDTARALIEDLLANLQEWTARVGRVPSPIGSRS